MGHPKTRVPTMLTIAEFADQLGVSPKSVRRWIATGDLRVHRFNRTVRIAEADALAFTATRRS